MLVPTLYVCHQVEQSRRQEERRDARLWRMLRSEPKRGPSRKTTKERPAARPKWVRVLLGNPSL